MIFANHNPQNCTKMCRSFFCQAKKLFSRRNLKNDRKSFLGQCNVETASCLGLYGLSSSKVARFEGGLFINFSRDTFFIFMFTQMDDMYLSYLPMKQI